ncbi:hypothetical protein NP493_376g00015 [Ridgeia piscesae]|uniref:Uncharacterized protein n=1 Tax=Ridgeia piscesae TaxID=27915 RepID=A0AAD9NV59_RIDPI|nr:hypothetical protein NP493_376g00015 [Ridgeia piscesae]
MQPQRPSDSGSGWLRRQNGVGYRNIRVLSEMNMPAIYEFAVEPPGETVKYPVYLTGTVGFQNIRLDTYFLRQEHLARQINRVLKRGCVLFVRRAKIQKPSRENSAQKTKAQLMKLYDYAWSATTRHGAHRAVELSSKVNFSQTSISD